MRILGANISARQFHRSAILTGLVVLLLSVEVTPPGTLVSSTPLVSGTETYVSTISWAIGLVLPEGPRFSGGGRLSWPAATNISAEVRLPRINETGGPILALLSLMTEGDYVLQVAAGLYPPSTTWRTYAWLIRSAGSNESYTWILNGSMPQMSSGAHARLSIFRTAAAWDYQLVDADTGGNTSGSFDLSSSLAPRRGDQEVFSLESYSSNSSTFQEMGNMTLESVFVNGERIASGGYLYGSWDPAHNPLFVVGSGNPPSFVSVERLQNDTVVWSYASGWTGNVSISPLSVPAEVTAVVLVVVSVILAALLALRLKRPPPNEANARQTAGSLA